PGAMARAPAAVSGGRRALLVLRPRGALPHRAAAAASRERRAPLARGGMLVYDSCYVLSCSGFTTQQSEVIVSALVKIMNTNLDMIYKDMVTKVQQEIALQQVMSHIGAVKKDMIILEKSEFSALRSENEKIKLELQQIKKQVMVRCSTNIIKN
uniref:Mitochondrial calcium uniporter regulator 1 n=1 Tax=Anas platyrhynchos platyrhynchos TaxID=8840 RepID=A0A493TYE0_ANAPP